MQSLILEPTPLTPEVNFDTKNLEFYFGGISRPENVTRFYEDLLAWLRRFAKDVGEDSASWSEGRKLTLKVVLEYINSSSAKYLFDILEQAKACENAKLTVYIEWHYEEDDDDMLEAGEDLSEMLEIEFAYVPY